MKRFGLILLFFVSLFVIIIFSRTLLNSSVQILYPFLGLTDSKEERILNLQQAIRFKTISYDDPTKVNYAEFNRFHRFLEKKYPLVHSKNCFFKSMVFRPLVIQTYENSAPGNAMIRTTMATAIIDFRILPEENPDSVTKSFIEV